MSDDIDDDIDRDSPRLHRRKGDMEDSVHIRHEMAIHELNKKVEALIEFSERAELPVSYIESIIRRNNDRSELYKRIAANVLGWGVMGVITGIGWIITTIIWPALLAKIRQVLGG